MIRLEHERSVLSLKDYNESRLLSVDILSGREYRRKLRKEKRSPSKLFTLLNKIL